MSDLLIKLRQQLVSMIEEIDNCKIALDDTIIIRREDFKSIKFLFYIGNNVNSNLFEYKNGVKFILGSEKDFKGYNNETYNKLMDGTLEVLILNKRNSVLNSLGYSINYELEPKKKTTLRNLYSPIIDENNEQIETDND